MGRWVFFLDEICYLPTCFACRRMTGHKISKTSTRNDLSGWVFFTLSRGDIFVLRFKAGSHLVLILSFFPIHISQRTNTPGESLNKTYSKKYFLPKKEISFFFSWKINVVTKYFYWITYFLSQGTIYCKQIFF